MLLLPWLLAVKKKKCLLLPWLLLLLDQMMKLLLLHQPLLLHQQHLLLKPLLLHQQHLLHQQQLSQLRSNLLLAKKTTERWFFSSAWCDAVGAMPRTHHLMSSANTLTMRCALSDVSGAPLISSTDTVVASP